MSTETTEPEVAVGEPPVPPVDIPEAPVDRPVIDEPATVDEPADRGSGQIQLTTPPSPPPCTEDMDCWDCSTMGNMICGPVSDPASFMLPTTGSSSLFLLTIAVAFVAIGKTLRRIGRC